MLILKQNAANTVPTPPAGKGTIFLDDSDTLSVKTSDGNVETFPTVAASNAQVVFMNGTSLSGEAALTYDFNNNVLNVSGNVAAGNVKTDNLLYANGTPWDLQQPGGSNTQIQFNDADSFGGSAALTFDKTSNLVTVAANLNANNVNVTTHVTSGNVWANSGTVGAQTLKGEGGNISNIQGANVSGTVGSATTAGTVTTNAQPNITSVGTLSSLVVSGTANTGAMNPTGHIIPTAAATYDLGSETNPWRDLWVSGNSIRIGNSRITSNATSLVLQNPDGGQVVVSGNSVASSTSIVSGTSNVSIPSANGNVNTSVGGTANVLVITATGANVLGTLNATGNANVGNIGATQGVFTNVSGNGSALSSLTGANVTGAVAFATTANAVAGANVSGEVGFAAVANSVAGANVSGQVGNALVAGTVYTNSQPNITSVGTLTSLAVTGNVTAGNVYANGGTIGATNLTGTLTTASQPNITSVGTLSSLTATGNVSAGNLTTTGVLSVTGTGVSSIAGNLDMTSNNIINLAAPVNSTDAATKQYVDDVAQGLHVHAPCSAATPDTLANISGGTITYNNGSSGVGATLTTTGSYTTVDGVNIATIGTRVLVKNEANTAHNGIYVYSSGTVLTRASDYDTPTEMAGGDFTFVQNGTVYNDTGWVQTDPVTTVGTSAVVFVQFSGAGTYTAGTGLTLTGTVFSVNASQTQVTALGTVTTGTWNSLVGSSATFAAGLSGANLASITGANVTGQVGNALVAGTVYTASQPNITSVGTLTSLSVTGNISAGNVSATTFTGAHSGNGAALTDLNASNISSGTLAQARLANSSLTVNGTAISLGGSATITANTTQTLTLGSYLTGTSFNGGTAVTATVDATTTNTASKVVARDASGNFAAGTITATLSGAATTAGTVTTAAQPNITSVGTLTTLTVSGATSVTSNSALTTTNLTTGANSTAGYITGNWTLTTGSKLQATYADLAEKYVSDAAYGPGTVLVFGGSHEVTLADEHDSHRVAGVVSTNPAYVMNSGCQGEHVVDLALQGRVPVKVHGPVVKGDLMVSGPNGHAVANNMARAGTIIGKALQNFSGDHGVIEVVIGRV